MKRIHILESKLKYLLDEGKNAEKAKLETYKVIERFFGYASWLSYPFNDEAANPNHLSIRDYIENKLRELLFHANCPDAFIRLEPIMMNVALHLGFEQQEQDVTRLNRLAMIVRYIEENYRKPDFPIQLSQLNINNTTYDTLNDLFGSIIDGEIEEDNQAANSYAEDSVMNPNYEVKEVNSFDEAEYYGRYSCSKSPLCYGEASTTWDQYTNDGANKAYVILRKGWKDIPEIHGENTPYDEYGLSMIFVFITPDGNLAYSNTRWNHDTEGKGPRNVDQSFNKTKIAELLNVNFNSIFKPWSNKFYESIRPILNRSIERNLRKSFQNYL